LSFLKTTTQRFIDFIYKILHNPQHLQALVLWTAAFITGLLSVEYARLFKFCERMFFSVYEQSNYIYFFSTPACLLVGWWVVFRWSKEAGGSGIPQIMAANETDYKKDRPRVDRLLSMRVAAVKIASSVFAVAGGAAIGREGPTLQISASIFHFFGKKIRKIYPHMDSNTWIIAGSAAGLGSAFNTPLGGIVYAIEEMGTLHFQKVKTSLFTSMIIAGLVSQWLLGSYLYLGFPQLNRITFDFVPYALLTGLVTGGLGATFGVLLAKMVFWRASFTKTSHQALITLGCGLLMAGLIWMSRSAGGSGAGVINGLLFKGEQASPLIALYRFLASGISYLSGVAGGIFAPSLAAGAALGSSLEGLLFTGHANLMILLGMIGFLTGVTRTPFTSFILVLEMTDRHSAILPMMMCALTANAAALFISKEGFYEIMKEKYMGPPPAPEPTPVAQTPPPMVSGPN
jgi:H+/Cl- antiporter ClcA